MGKTGGHKKKGAQTGSQKKTVKRYEREHKETAGARKQGVEEQQRLLGPEGLKYLEQFTGTEGAKNYANALQESQRVLNPILEGQRQEAMTNFDRTTRANLFGQYAQGTGGSSAYNQALAAARADLHQGLFNRQQEMSLNMANQQQNQAYNAANSIYGIRQNTAANLAQAGLQQGNTALATDRFVYAPKSTPILGQIAVGAAGGAAQGATTSMMAPSAGAAAPAAGAAAAPAAAAPAAAVAASSRDVKENIKDYEKGLEVIRELNVKQYDYTIPVEGNSKDRVGVIAEDIPNEIRTKIGEINAVDVYGLVSILVNAVKQLDQKVKKLEAA